MIHRSCGSIRDMDSIHWERMPINLAGVDFLMVSRLELQDIGVFFILQLYDIK